MKLSQRLLALLAALLAVLGCLSPAALAAGEEPAAETEELSPPDEPLEYRGPGYILREETVIAEDETPLAGAPFTEQDCCILHFVLLVGALAVTVYYVHDRKRRQEREFELRSEL